MIIFTIVTILVASFGTTLISYFVSANIIDNYYKNLCMDCAENFATFMDPVYLMELRQVLESDEYQAVRDHAEETDNEQEVIDYLRGKGLWDRFVKARDQIDSYIESMDVIEYTYILARSGGVYDMYLMDDSTNPAYVSGSITESEPEFVGVDASKRIEPTISNGEWGWLCSAYVPLYLEDGTVVCQIGCDIAMDDVMRERRTYLAYSLLGAMLFTMLMVVLSVIFTDHILVRRVSQLTRELKKFDPMPGQEYDAAGVVRANSNSNDEIGDLYHSVHDMQVRIIDNINEMDEMNIELDRAARMKSDFLANMSHEIRTPMNAVIGMAEIAAREDIPETARDALTQIQKSGRNLLNIINDILDYSKIESGKMEILPERYEPVSELNDIANILSTRIGFKDIELYVVSDTDLPHALYGDAMRIRQILINLANNAIKFTQEGSVSIRLSCSEVKDDVITLTYHIVDTGIGIKQEDLDKLFTSFTQVDSRRNRSVEGTGLGLAISQRLVKAMGGELGVDSIYGEGSDFWFTIPQKVEDPARDLYIEDAGFKKAISIDNDASRSRIFLDEMQKLDIEYDLIPDIQDYRPSGKQDYIFLEYSQYSDRMRGFFADHPKIKGVVLVDYSSDFNPDLANVHTVRRPVSTLGMIRALNDNDEVIRSSGIEEDFTIDFTAPDARILVVDDNAINITVVEGLLSPVHINIDSALSGQEAINKITANNYDIVFMDHMMPGLDGVDTTKIIRELMPDKKDLVIIALSANVMESARKLFTDAGMNDFAAKPIELRELVSKLKKWLPKEKIIKGMGEVRPEESEEAPILGYEGLNSVAAVKTIGSVPLYNRIVEEYFKSGEEKYAGIESAYEAEDIDDYTIRVHALKSSSRQIGAVSLGAMAEELENAGKAGDMETIHDKTGPMLEAFRNLLSDLAGYYSEEGSDDEKALIDDAVLKDQLALLHEACEELDMDAMEAVGTELRKYSYPDRLKDQVNRLIHAIDSVDSEGCEALIEEIREYVGKP